MKNKLYFLTSLVLLFYGCKKIAEPQPIGHAYYPLQIGKHITYSVDKLIHDAFEEKTDTLHYWLQESISDTLLDNTGHLTYLLNISESNDSGKSWAFTHYAIVKSDNYSAQRYELDIRKVKLSYPVKNRKFWDANELNINDYQRARMVDTEQPYTIGDLLYDETITIDLGNDTDPFFSFYEKEVYADSIGLILREYRNIESQPNKYKHGIEYTQKLIQTNW